MGSGGFWGEVAAQTLKLNAQRVLWPCLLPPTSTHPPPNLPFCPLRSDLGEAGPRVCLPQGMLWDKQQFFVEGLSSAGHQDRLWL